MLVGEEEFFFAIAAETFGERTGCPVKGHCVLIIVQESELGGVPEWSSLPPPRGHLRNSAR
jgi:hypothetical protein